MITNQTELQNQGIQLQGAATYVNTSGEVKLADPELSTLQSTPSEEGNQSRRFLSSCQSRGLEYLWH